MNHGGVVLLHARTSPGTHAVAVAGIGVIALDVPMNPHRGNVIGQGLGGECFKHGLVGRIVARCQDHAFRSDFLILTSFGVAHEYASYSIAFLNKFFGDVSVVGFCVARSFCRCNLFAMGNLEAAKSDGRGERRAGFGTIIVPIGQGI